MEHVSQALFMICRSGQLESFLGDFHYFCFLLDASQLQIFTPHDMDILWTPFVIRDVDVMNDDYLPVDLVSLR